MDPEEGHISIKVMISAADDDSLTHFEREVVGLPDLALLNKVAAAINLGIRLFAPDIPHGLARVDKKVRKEAP